MKSCDTFSPLDDRVVGALWLQLNLQPLRERFLGYLEEAQSCSWIDTVPCDKKVLEKLLKDIDEGRRKRIEHMIEDNIFPVLEDAIVDYFRKCFVLLDKKEAWAKNGPTITPKSYFRIRSPSLYISWVIDLNEFFSGQSNWYCNFLKGITDNEFARSDKNREYPMITFHIKPEFMHWLQWFPLSKAVNDVNTILSENALLYDIAILRMWNKQNFFGWYIFRYSPKGMNEVDQEAINSLLRKAFHLYYKWLPVENPSASSDWPAEFAQPAT